MILVGSTVTLIDLENEETKQFKLVGKDEANIKKNLVFFKSPIGKGLIGKKKGELVTIKIPSGEKSFEIKSVKYI